MAPPESVLLTLQTPCHDFFQQFPVAEHVVTISKSSVEIPTNTFLKAILGIIPYPLLIPKENGFAFSKRQLQDQGLGVQPIRELVMALATCRCPWSCSGGGKKRLLHVVLIKGSKSCVPVKIKPPVAGI